MGEDDRKFEQLAEPRVHQIRQAFIESAATETVGDCLEAADRVTALLVTLPPGEAQRYVAYLTDVLGTIQDRLPSET